MGAKHVLKIIYDTPTVFCHFFLMVILFEGHGLDCVAVKYCVVILEDVLLCCSEYKRVSC